MTDDDAEVENAISRISRTSDGTFNVLLKRILEVLIERYSEVPTRILMSSECLVWNTRIWLDVRSFVVGSTRSVLLEVSVWKVEEQQFFLLTIQRSVINYY